MPIGLLLMMMPIGLLLMMMPIGLLLMMKTPETFVAAFCPDPRHFLHTTAGIATAGKRGESSYMRLHAVYVLYLMLLGLRERKGS